MSWALRFLGVGGAQATALGASAAVVECDGQPVLLIDCGPGTVDRYWRIYAAPPPAIYITHTHLDHIGDMEQLFARVWFDPAWRGRIKVFAHAALVPWLHARVGDYPGALAEGGVNFWQAFQLLPCSRGFWLDGWWFDVFPSRHHVPGTSWGLALAGALAYTGDTRPIPEALAQWAGQGELVAHDCALAGNPSHTGLDDLAREYPPQLRARLLLYHYGSAVEREALVAAGYRAAVADAAVALSEPLAPRPDAG